MKTTPMLFNSDMVRALLDGRKTQTRRVMKPVKDQMIGCEMSGCEVAGEANNGDYRNSPYGQPGDLIWVRETFTYDDNGHEEWPVFRADGTALPELPETRSAPRWRPSIHMPRWASRLTLRITDVRVERVRDILTDDVCDEGLDFESGQIGDWFNEGEHLHIAGSPLNGERFAFARLWDSIYADRGHGWDTNPWVWALTFEVIHTNVDRVIEGQAA